MRANGRDISKKMLHKAQQGGTVGRAKLGYLNVRKTFDGRLVNTIDIDPERAPLIKWAFEAYASGDYTINELHRALADQGLRTRPSRRWPAKPVSQSQISQILHDPYYAGVIRYVGELFPGRHEPLITKELFLRVQDVLSERAQRGQRDVTHHHYLKGLLYCQKCFEKGTLSRLVFSQIKGSGGVYDYFICRGRQEGICDLTSLPVAEVEEKIARHFADIGLPADFIERIRGDIEDAVAATQVADREMRGNIARQLKTLDRREEQLLDLAADPDFVTEKLKDRLRVLALERAALRETLTQTDSKIERGVATIMTYLELLAEPGRLYRHATENARRQLLEAFYSQIRLNAEIDVFADERESVAELRDGARAMHEFKSSPRTQEGSTERKNPGLSTGASAFETSVGLLADLFRSFSLSKATLVAGAGFEPTTSGL